MDLVPRDPTNTTRTQLAYRIDTSLVNPLGHLPPSVAINPSVLAQRNLERGWRMRLPNGQDIARAMGLVPLEDNKILIGKFTGDPADIIGPIDAIHPAFKKNCPLWTYVLAETVETDVDAEDDERRKEDQDAQTRPGGWPDCGRDVCGAARSATAVRTCHRTRSGRRQWRSMGCSACAS